MLRNNLTLAILIALAASIMVVAPNPAVAQGAAPAEILIGTSGQGRPISAVRFGNGSRKLVLVSNTHGGPEANTYTLANELIAYFRSHPEALPPTIRLYIIPTINPDGLALGTRFNGRGVDLNRNMNTDLDTCTENDWQVEVQGAYGVVSDTGGPYPDSEVESRLIRDFLLDANGAIFVHSNAGLVFPAFCEHQPSIALGEVYAKGAGYTYSRFWPKYLITGGMHDWAGSLGIAAITPELVTGDSSEFEQNLAGLLAVLAQGEALPTPEDHILAGQQVPALIWRYWLSHGGEAMFGMPLGPARSSATGIEQPFSRANLMLQPDQADTANLVQPTMLGNTLGATFAADPVLAAQFGGSYDLVEAFAAYWQRWSGEEVLGKPISAEFVSRSADGGRRVMQFFERGALAYYPEYAGTSREVQPEPLGWLAQQRANVVAPGSAFQVR